jgi:predicted RNA binding protein YcfA (HicA-like mRNA interferase family)
MERPGSRSTRAAALEPARDPRVRGAAPPGEIAACVAGAYPYRVVSSREVLKRLKADGWFIVEKRGSHVQMKHPAKPGRVTLVHPKKDLALGTLRSIEKQSGVTLR